MNQSQTNIWKNPKGKYLCANKSKAHHEVSGSQQSGTADVYQPGAVNSGQISNRFMPVLLLSQSLLPGEPQVLAVMTKK